MFLFRSLKQRWAKTNSWEVKKRLIKLGEQHQTSVQPTPKFANLKVLNYVGLTADQHCTNINILW